MSATITPAQRIVIIRLWSQVCKDRSWKASDRDLRLAKFSELLGREIPSMDDIERIDECTKLMKSLKAMLGTDLNAARESDDQTINQARVIRSQILDNLIPCLELYIEDVRAYLTTIIESKNRYRQTDRPTRELTLMDLDARQLKHIQYTLAGRLNTLRNKKGETIHQMKTRAMVYCTCSECTKGRASHSVRASLPPTTIAA